MASSNKKKKVLTNQKPWLKSYPVDINWADDIPQTTMVEMFDESVRKHRDLPCINFMGKKYTYGEIGNMVDHFAKSLQDQGIGKGSTVGVCLPNTPFYLVAYYGAMKAGARVANFNPTSPADALAKQINDSKTDLMVAINLKGTKSMPLFPSVEKALEISNLKKIVVCDMSESLPFVKKHAFRAINFVKGIRGKSDMVKFKEDSKHISFKSMLKSNGDVKPVHIKTTDIALLQYTGGTTGTPKGAALSHGNLTANINQCNIWFSAGREKSKTQDKNLAVLPFFHVFSMTVQLNLSIKMGAEIITMPKPDVKEIIKIINKDKPTIFAAVPALYKKIIDHKDSNSCDFSSLKVCVSGGAPLTEPIMRRFKNLTGLGLVEGYGLSETSPLVTANPVIGKKKAGSIGMPIPGTEVKFADVDFPDKDVEVGMEGEICLRGPQVMKEYFGMPEETKAVFDKDGFFHTGDIGVMDSEGYITITDRKKDMIIVNGFKAFPKKIEDAIRKFAGVSEVIVIGIPDTKSGEAPKAFIQLEEGQTIDNKELVTFLKNYLTHYELPRITNIEIRDELPLTQIGKPDKKPLREEEAAKAKIKARKLAADNNKPKPPKVG